MCLWLIAHMIYIIEDQGALVNEKGEEQPLKAGDFAPVNPEGLTQVTPTISPNNATRGKSPSR